MFTIDSPHSLQHSTVYEYHSTVYPQLCPCKSYKTLVGVLHRAPWVSYTALTRVSRHVCVPLGHGAHRLQRRPRHRLYRAHANPQVLGPNGHALLRCCLPRPLLGRHVLLHFCKRALDAAIKLDAGVAEHGRVLANRRELIRYPMVVRLLTFNRTPRKKSAPTLESHSFCIGHVAVVRGQPPTLLAVPQSAAEHCATLLACDRAECTKAVCAPYLCALCNRTIHASYPHTP